MAQDPGLAFSQNLVENFIRFKMFQIEQDRLERREKRYSDQLQSNRLFNQQRATALESRFTRTEARLTKAGKSLEELRSRPQRGTKAHFESLGYDPEIAQQLQDQASGLTSKPLSPQQMVVIGQAMMNNPLSTEMYESGRTLLEKGLTVIQEQNPTFPSRAPGDKSTPITTPPKLDDFFRGEFGPEAEESTVFPSRQGEEREQGFGKRPDGTEKGTGFFGELQLPDGRVATEFSIGVEFDGKETQIPTLVPTLTQQEVDLMTNDIIPNNKKIPDTIRQKAIAHAKKRISEGKSPFAQEGEIADTDVRLQSAPDERLNQFWNDLSDEEKKEIIQRLDENPDNINQILRILESG